LLLLLKLLVARAWEHPFPAAAFGRDWLLLLLLLLRAGVAGMRVADARQNSCSGRRCRRRCHRSILAAQVVVAGMAAARGGTETAVMTAAPAGMTRMVGLLMPRMVVLVEMMRMLRCGRGC